jgi:hypothetical protein
MQTNILASLLELEECGAKLVKTIANLEKLATGEPKELSTIRTG